MPHSALVVAPDREEGGGAPTRGSPRFRTCAWSSSGTRLATVKLSEGGLAEGVRAWCLMGEG